MIRWLQSRWQEISGLTPRKLLRGSDAKGGLFKGGTFSPALKQLLSERARISDALDQALDNWKFHLSKNKKIKTVAVISAPGIETCLQVGFEDGKSFRLPLDGPALFNLNNEVAAALSKHLHRPYGGKG